MLNVYYGLLRIAIEIKSIQPHQFNLILQTRFSFKL